MLRLSSLFAACIALCGCGSGELSVPPPRDASLDGDARGTTDVGVPDVALDAGDVGDAGLCGDAACSQGEICIRGRCAGCCDLPPSCIPIPAGCTGTLSCGCFAGDPCGGCTSCGSVGPEGIECVNCRCTCAAPWTPIATPDGARAIAELRVGDLVYSVDRGRVEVVPVARVHRTPVTRHAMVRVVLASGDTLEISGGHPTADGRAFDRLAPGDRLGDAEITSVATVPYDEPFTYDILPASDTGTYFAGGAWIGSTLAPAR